MEGGPRLPGGQAGAQSGEDRHYAGPPTRGPILFTRTWQRPPTEEDVRGSIEEFVRDEIYYREAVAARLDRDDGAIRQRMRQKMEFILEDITAQREPTDKG